MNQNNLKDLVISTFQEILTEDPNFFFTNRLKILSWKSKKIAGALITKIGNIRYLGLIRKDKNGQEYWKYRPLNRNSEPEQSGPENSTPLPLDNIAQFQQRQSQSQARQSLVKDQINHGNKLEQSINNSQSN